MTQKNELNFKVVYHANGYLDAETIKLFLEAQGVEAVVYQESAGITYGLTIGPLGDARILVPETQEAEALKLLAEMEKGKFIADSYIGEGEEVPEA
ncbi:MAG: DUF2007 domain-containing protein [Anaerolineaceae bacterium]|nr:DUF2007 domain-containing protein [Anaerolineaceae bacterium]